MSPSSISNSSGSTWRRLRREIGHVLLILIVLELICRLAPIHSLLSRTLDSYENLLYYDPFMPSYQVQLDTHPEYTVWLVGSSYMMTGLNPQLVQDSLKEQGLTDITTQNYGLNRMLNLDVMSEVFDRWMLQMDRPRYMVIGTSHRNFVTAASNPPPILSSPYENMYIFPRSVDDFVTGFLYKYSLFYHYVVLARNALHIPRDQTIRPARPEGGYVERTTTYNCNLNRDEVDAAQRPVSDMEGGLDRLDRFIDVIRSHTIPVLVVNVPMPLCTIYYEGYKDYHDYDAHYLKPLAQHLADENIAFRDLDTQFQAQIPPETQPEYFADSAHPNTKGAALFSQWTGEILAEWLRSTSRQSSSGR
jgi:hypothetical protein